MKKIIIKNINFSYYDKTIFTNFNLTLKKELTFIIGNNGSGKSTLFGILSSQLPCDRNVYIDDVLMTKNHNILFLDVGYVRNIKGKVCDILKNDNDSMKIIEYFDLNDYMECDVSKLSFSLRVKVCIALCFINSYDSIFIDDVLCWLNKIDRNKILKKFKSIARKKIVVIITNNMEDTLYGNRLILMDRGNIVLDDKPIKFYNNENVLKKCEIGLPFMVDLSLNLKLYNTIDDIYFDKEKLVDSVWK